MRNLVQRGGLRALLELAGHFVGGLCGGTGAGIARAEHRLPVLMCFAFVVAVSSVAHLFVQQSLLEKGTPPGFIRFVVELNATATLQLLQADGEQFFSEIIVGVLQGGPMSGFLFIMVMRSLLGALSYVVPNGKGIVNAGADDVAFVLGRSAFTRAG